VHAIPRLAVAAGLLGTALTGCQVPARDQHLAQALHRFLAGAPRTPAATGRPDGAALRPRATPAPTPVAPIPEVPPTLDSPDRVAAALAAAETTIRASRTPAPALLDAAHTEQRAYDAVADHPDWRDPVVAAVPPTLHDAVQADATAAVDLRELNRSSDDLPHWRVTDPPPAAELLRWYGEAQQQSGIPWGYLAAINLVETRMGRIHADSIAGAQGPMQFLPETWQQYGQGDVHDPHAAILAAGRFLAAAGGPGDMASALRQYNPSDLYVAAVTAYAQRMLSDPRAFFAYYEWQADAAVTSGDVILPSGYSR
jgi:membrane-bound lytic murein transglycosylase B